MRGSLTSDALRDVDLLQNPGDVLKFKKGVGSTLLLACGALGREIVWLIERNGLKHLDVQCLPASLHHTPGKIPDAVRDQIRANKDKYEKIFVLYGDCGTAGALDRVLEEEGGIERISGPHCFSFFWGNEAFAEYGEEEITTFYLTDFFCRSFDKFVWQAFGLDRNKNMVDFVFGNYEKVVFMPQTDDPSLERKAQEIAARLGLEYERRFVGYGELETAIQRA